MPLRCRGSRDAAASSISQSGGCAEVAKWQLLERALWSDHPQVQVWRCFLLLWFWCFFWFPKGFSSFQRKTKACCKEERTEMHWISLTTINFESMMQAVSAVRASIRRQWDILLNQSDQKKSHWGSALLCFAQVHLSFIQSMAWVVCLRVALQFVARPGSQDLQFPFLCKVSLGCQPSTGAPTCFLAALVNFCQRHVAASCGPKHAVARLHKPVDGFEYDEQGRARGPISTAIEFNRVKVWLSKPIHWDINNYPLHPLFEQHTHTTHVVK